MHAGEKNCYSEPIMQVARLKEENQFIILGFGGAFVRASAFHLC